MKKYTLVILLVVFACHWSFTQTDETIPESASLEDKIQNPIANMVSIPINYNLSTNDDNSNVINIHHNKLFHLNYHPSSL